MGKLDFRELGAIRWLLGQLLVLISLVGAYSLDLGSDNRITTSIVIVLLTCLFPKLVERIPQWFWKVAPVFLLFAIVADFFLSAGDILEPLFRTVLILILYRALQIRTPREDLQVLLLTLFLLILSGVLSQEITFGLQLFLFAPIAMGLLFAVNLSHREAGMAELSDERGIFAEIGWAHVLKRAQERLDSHTLFAGLILFILTTGMTLVFFILLPRFDIGAALPFPRLMTKQSLTGFSDNVRYGDVVSILNDDRIAMRVDVSESNVPAWPYWRMVILDAYYDGGFRVSPRVARNYRSVQNFRFDFDSTGLRLGQDPTLWTVYLEGGVSSYIPNGDFSRTILFKNRLNLNIHELTNVMKTRETNANTLSIRFEGLDFSGVVPIGAEDPLLVGRFPILADTTSPEYLKEVRYPDTLLVVPQGRENERILDKALADIGHYPGMPIEEFAIRAVNYLRQGRGYSLEGRIPDGEADTLLRWLESVKPGHCELYAGAFVLISRYAGYPCRMVTGFAGGDWNGFENYYMVRNRNAHAWCEIFNPGLGWIRVDPTPGNDNDATTVDDAIAGGFLLPDKTWKAYMDSLRVLWFRRIIQFDGADQAEMADSVRNAGLLGFEWFKERFAQLKSRLKTDIEAVKVEGSYGRIVLDISIPIVTIVLLVWLLKLYRRRHVRLNFEAIIRRKAGRLLEELPDELLAKAGLRAMIQQMRFGPVDSWPEEPARSLKAAVKVARKA
ncbi:MAG: transglutaminaseTgpA domain-containing protein [Puniceicoccaceae bacterium]